MKKFLYDKKKLGIIIILIGLVLILVSMGKQFESRLKYTILLQNDIKTLNQYKALNGKLLYKLPSDWKVEEKKFGGGEIIYHNSYSSEDAVINGFIQVWNNTSDLESFLKISKQISEEQNVLTYYKIKPLKIAQRQGYLVEYSIINKQDVNYRAYEYFIQGQGMFFRFSFYVRNENFHNNMEGIFDSIVRTFSYSD